MLLLLLLLLVVGFHLSQVKGLTFFHMAEWSNSLTCCRCRSFPAAAVCLDLAEVGSVAFEAAACTHLHASHGQRRKSYFDIHIYNLKPATKICMSGRK